METVLNASFYLKYIYMIFVGSNPSSILSIKIKQTGAVGILQTVKINQILRISLCHDESTDNVIKSGNAGVVGSE